MKRILGFAAAVLLSLSAVAHADTLNFTLNNASQSGHPGTYTFQATVSAPITNGGDIFLNGDSAPVSTPASVDDSDFFNNAPFFLSAGQSATFDIFTVTVPAGTAAGNYFGTFTIYGGADGGATDPIAQANFNVTITPEPSSFMLLGTGLAGSVAAFRRRRSI